MNLALLMDVLFLNIPHTDINKSESHHDAPGEELNGGISMRRSGERGLRQKSKKFKSWPYHQDQCDRE